MQVSHSDEQMKANSNQDSGLKEDPDFLQFWDLFSKQTNINAKPVTAV